MPSYIMYSLHSVKLSKVKVMIEKIGSSKESYWDIEDEVATSFNRLKAKMYNLIEASVIDKSQQEALKGLIKGFANDEYRTCIKNTIGIAKQAGFIDEGTGRCVFAEPLESKNY